MVDSDHFPAVLFAGSWPAGLRVSVSLDVQSLRLHSDSLNLQIEYDALDIQRSGWSGDGLLVEWETSGERHSLSINDPEVASKLVEGAPIALARRVENWQRQARSSRRRLSLAIVLILSLGLLPLILLGVTVVKSDRLIDAAVRKIPIEWEIQAGEKLAEVYLSDANLVPEGVARSSFEMVASRLLAATESPYPLVVHLIEGKEANAFALPGGTIVVWSGLLTETERPEELAGVLAHEIEHVHQRHATRAIVRNLGLRFVLSWILGSDPNLLWGVDVLGNFEEKRFSRKQEAEADAGAIRRLEAARIDPMGLVTFFERYSGRTGDPPRLFSTHPTGAERALRLREKIQPGMYEPFDLPWEEVVAESHGHVLPQLDASEGNLESNR